MWGLFDTAVRALPVKEDAVIRLHAPQIYRLHFACRGLELTSQRCALAIHDLAELANQQVSIVVLREEIVRKYKARGDPVAMLQQYAFGRGGLPGKRQLQSRRCAQSHRCGWLGRSPQAAAEACCAGSPVRPSQQLLMPAQEIPS